MKFIFVLFIFFSTQTSAQQFLFSGKMDSGQMLKSKLKVKVSLSGTITDASTGDPLAGASIYLTDDRMGAIADAKGKYFLTNIPDGHHVVEVSYAGYTTLVEHIELNVDTEKNFKLSTVVVENQGVIITGVTGAISIRKAPVSVSSIRKAALLQSSSSNIIDALTKIPGVAQLSTGPAISKPFIRGLGFNRVVVVNEAVRQEGQQWGDEHGVEIDELSVGRVEIVKGPASLIYGSDALAGVINFITNTPVAEGTFKGNILTNYQSNNGLMASNVNLASNYNGLNWNVYGTYKSAGDYKNKYDGKVLNSRFTERNFGGYIGLNKSWGYSHFVFSRFYQQLGLVEGDRDNATGGFILFSGTPYERIASQADLTSRNLFIPYQKVQHNKFILDNNFAIKNSRLKINLAYQNNKRQEFGNPEDLAEKELFFDLKTINYSVQWHFPEIKEWHTTVGVNGMSQKNLNKGEEVIIPAYNIFDIGAFVFVQRLFKKATISGGLRMDNRSIHASEYFDGTVQKFANFKKNFSNLSGSIGISYEPSSRVAIKANIARGFRAPTLAELASNGAHEGANRYEYGNQLLKSETSMQMDWGIDINYEHISLRVNAFYNNINNFIFYRKLQSTFGGDSLMHVDGENIPAFQYNQHHAWLRGFEASIDFHPHPMDWLHFENTLSFVRGTFRQEIDGSNNLPLIPAAKVTSEMRASFTRAGKYLRSAYFKINADNFFKQNKAFTGFDTETQTNGYTLLNAGFGSDITNKKMVTIIGFHFAITNITNVAYQSHLSRLKYAAENLTTGRRGIFNSGRNFSIKANIPLDFSRK